MSRLGLWGRGTPFPDFNTFAAKIERAGVGAMELLAMDMKASTLSFYAPSTSIPGIL